MAEQQQQQGQEGGEAWAEDFEEQQQMEQEGVKIFGVEGEGPPLSYEEKAAVSDFNGLMDDLKEGRAEIVEGEQQPEGPLAAEFLGNRENDEVEETHDEVMEGAFSGGAAAGVDDMAAEFLRQHQGAAAGNAEDMDEEEFARQFLEQQRRQLGLEDDDDADWKFDGQGEEDDWVQEYMEASNKASAAQHNSEYPFDENNPYLFHENPFEEGINFLAAGVLSEAVLAFEAACQQGPEKLEAWQYLGTTQAENEKDNHAIIALNKARNLCPTHPQVLLALSACYTNEMMTDHAMSTLKSWLKCDPKFADLEEHLNAVGPSPEEEQAAALADDGEFVKDYFFVDGSEHRKVCQLFEAAAQIDPTNVEIHVGLGTLRHLGHEYLKAASHFEEAVKLQPENEKLWNKLGATLANGQQSDKAIDAYQRALDINPGFVRAQYNLGIANSNLGRHHEAARHFVKAIMLQSGWTDPSCDDKAPTRSTRDIWDVLRMSLGCLERQDLVQQSWQHKLAPFVGEFNCAPAAMVDGGGGGAAAAVQELA